MATPQRLAFLREALALVRLGESGGKVGLELYNFIAAIVGPKADGTARRGLNVWTNAKRHYETLVDKPCAWPETFRGSVSGCRDRVVLFDDSDLGSVLLCILPKMRARSLFATPEFAEELRIFLRDRNVSSESLDAYLRDLQSEIVEATAAFGTHQIRTTRMPEITSELLVACDDILTAIGIQDPRHDWDNWLRIAVENIADQRYQACLNQDDAETRVKPLENTPLLLSKKLEGSSQLIRVINYAMYRQIINCYVAKGKLRAEHVSAALELYDRFKVGDTRLADEIFENEAPEEARAFVMGDAETARQVAKRRAPSELVRPGKFARRGYSQAQLVSAQNAIAARLESRMLSELQRHQEALALRDQQYQEALALRDQRHEEALALRDRRHEEALALRDQRNQEALQVLLAARHQEVLACTASFASQITQAFQLGFANFSLSLCQHVRAVIESAMPRLRPALRLAPRQTRHDPLRTPEDQRATTQETGPRLLQLATVLLDLVPDLPYLAWCSVRGAVGHYCLKERLRRHGLGAQHPDYVAMPRRWAYLTNHNAGGGARFVYTIDQWDLVRRVLLRQIVTTAAQRAAGAPAPTESLAQRAQRVAAGLTVQERTLPWPSGDLEPNWEEMNA
jgi:hypothetical protein